MSLIAIVNLAERLLNQGLSQDPQGQINSKSARVKEGQNETSTTRDRFTPSAVTGQGQATAQAAGLFRANQVTFFSAAADFLLAQSAPQTASDPVAAQAPPTPTPLAQSAPATLSGIPIVALAPSATKSSNTQGATTPAVAAAPGGAAVLPSATPAVGSNSPASSLNQLRALNNALAALGLDPLEVAQIDRIASLIQDFNPTAFLSLVHQLEALAQANSPQSAAANAANGTVPGSNFPAPANAASATNTNGATSGGFQLRELVIKFTGVQETLTGGANGNGGNTTLQLSAFNLQVEEVNLTLTNNGGQIVQLQAPPQAANATNGNPAGGTQTTLKASAATG